MVYQESVKIITCMYIGGNWLTSPNTPLYSKAVEAPTSATDGSVILHAVKNDRPLDLIKKIKTLTQVSRYNLRYIIIIVIQLLNHRAFA